MASDDDFISDALEEFDKCVEHEADNRLAAIEDLKFARLAEQWDPKDRKNRESEGRPCLTINRLPAFIRQVVNDARQNAPSITVHPVDSGADPKTAELITGLFRNIETASGADVAYDTALEFAVTAGWGYWRVNTDYATDDTFDLDIRIKQIANPFSIYGDYNNDGPDSSEWNIAFVVDDLSKDAFEKKYKGADKVDWEGGNYADLKAPWRDGDRVQIAERWSREESAKTICLMSNGEVLAEDVYSEQKALFEANGVTCVTTRKVKGYSITQAIMSGAEVLERRKWAGRYIPIVPCYGEDINIEGKRYLRSMVRDAKDPQRMFNYWRTASTELVALAPKAPFIGPKGAFKSDQAKWQTANARSHSHIEYDGQVPPQRQPFAGVPAGALQEALNASDDMKAVMGLFDASLGAQGNETSGRAILARQKEGDVGSFHFSDNQARAIKHTARIVLDLIPHVYNAARMVRVMGQDKTAQTVPVNQPVQIQQQGPNGEQMEPILHTFDLTAGKYDVTVDVGPSYTTQRQEAASQMMELVRSFPEAASVIGDLIAKNLDWPGADEIAQRLQQLQAAQMGGAQGQGQQQPQIPPEVIQQMQELHQRLTQLEQQNQQLVADHSIAAEKNQIAAYDATTRRLSAVTAASKPSHLPRQT